ncbi:MAG: D-alanyl-D-alanine dipeptidase [Acidobacteria bacterium]|nr:D-alanyl-D-alanine dipeptidase [Acidobacteriota bacterium]
MFRRSNFALLLFALACAGAAPTPAGLTIAPNRYGLQVVSDFATYDRLVASDPDKRLVELQAVVPSIHLDVRYATSNNFMHETLYPVARVFVRRPVAEALRGVQRELATEHLGLKVFDGYRPYRVTERMWEPIRNPDFVADPAKGSRHNRGAAVDLTLVDDAGNELAMPTPYDDFTPRARQDFSDLAPAVVANRAKLRDVMTRHGFEPLESEWWHFDYAGWKNYELMDLDLAALSRGARRSATRSPANAIGRSGLEARDR